MAGASGSSAAQTATGCEEFEAALTRLCEELAADVVRCCVKSSPWGPPLASSAPAPPRPASASPRDPVRPGGTPAGSASVAPGALAHLQIRAPPPESASRDVAVWCPQVRNGEGTTHVIRVVTTNAPTEALARGVGKAVVNSPLFKSAVAGNDPNIGRLVSAVGSYLGQAAPNLPLEQCEMRMGGRTIFSRGAFAIDAATEDALHEHM